MSMADLYDKKILTRRRSNLYYLIGLKGDNGE